jgi:2',3'-cyclic-nucleotide 2'-phosphodiesterase (5'-nucleotidase family)
MAFKLFIYSVLFGAGLVACSFSRQKLVSNTLIVDSSTQTLNKIDSIVNPYKSGLQNEMNRIIAQSEVDFIKARPNGNLGFLVCDVLMEEMSSFTDQSIPVICMLNHGGLRSTLNQGNITVGDIYKLMPFDNTLVFVKLSASKIFEIQHYLYQSGGEPISGFYLENDLIYNSNKKPWIEQEFYVLTSDYLLNGGDKMNFFSNHLELIETNKLLRDILIQGIEKRKILHDVKEQRILFNSQKP